MAVAQRPEVMRQIILVLFLGLLSACSHHDLEAIDLELEGNEKAAYMSDVFSGMDREDVFVVECQMDHGSQRDTLHEMIQQHDLDIWSEGIPAVGQTFKMLLSEEQTPLVLGQFACHRPKTLAQYRLERINASGELTNPLIADLMFVAYNKTARAEPQGFFSDYQSYLDILKRLDTYKNGPKKALISKFGSLGKTVNGRSIPVVHLKSTVVNATRPIIW